MAEWRYDAETPTMLTWKFQKTEKKNHFITLASCVSMNEMDNIFKRTYAKQQETSKTGVS